eukprot:CAMPEP_0180412608 /NCGR_PEP_ID=MMETSP0989-20121125/44633_1 /TAXON_ID=697907 /ORGANISM="non described non described, Strain CCMP2293" /LENGTH=72 /DNA_ID=CAMNT_0022417089 /DNA_START=348 /DNA_END=565 /DNA_ORIENTATION=+
MSGVSLGGGVGVVVAAGVVALAAVAAGVVVGVGVVAAGGQVVQAVGRQGAYTLLRLRCFVSQVLGHKFAVLV